MLYAVGNSQLRYLTSQYGDSTLTKILKHRKSSLLGFAQTHDFYKAFKATVGKSYRDFYDEWRRHVNIYYNTIAGQMEPADSLGSEPLSLPGQYLYDIQYSPDTTQLAVLSLTSISRPVTRLQVMDSTAQSLRILADGSIRTPFAWSPDGASIVFARRTRNRQGSVLNDLFQVDVRSGKSTRLTYSRRAVAPTFSPDGKRIAFIGSERGTANIFILNLETLEETQLTTFEGDVQLSSLKWHPPSDRIAFSIFDQRGEHDIYVVHPLSGERTLIPGGQSKDQFPVWSPNQNRLAYTSFQDQVPNVFIYDLDTDSTHRVTRLVNGAIVHDWLPPDSTYPGGSLLITTSSSKQRDRAYRISALRRTEQPPLNVPGAYSRWTSHLPRNVIPDSALFLPQFVESRYRYKSFRNLTHLFSLGVPFYNAEDDWGLLGITSWTEPLAKHSIGLTASLAIPDPLNKSFFLGSYVNNQLKPTISFNGYRLLPTFTAYGDVYGVYEWSGGDVSMDWPLDWFVRPYVATRLDVRLRYLSTHLTNDNNYDPLPDGLLLPENGQKVDARIQFMRKKLRPYRGNVIHPLDGTGLRVGVTISGGDAEYIRGDVSLFQVLPFFGLNRLYIYGKAQALSGAPFPQDRLGFARFDDVQVIAPQFGIVAFSDTDRVRGFRSFAYGNRLLFGSIEYRMPFIPDLQTELLGMVSLGATTVSGFADFGGVWNDSDVVTQRVGLGLELKNTVTIGGLLRIMHALGIAQPAPNLGSTDDYEIYYRVRTSLPF